ncbi:hypothetical protein [Micromonospora sp. NPDC023814]|uniref:hypothetical protein n=1 Tax=Micromonospora sp. NPDC023814 TaxID=3154596 RepID=UPI0033F87DA4
MDSAVHGTVAGVVRDVVAVHAPEELVVVEGLAALGGRAVARRLRGSGARREALGFGLADVAVLVTPVVWLVLNEVAQRAAGAAVNRAERGFGALWRRVFQRGTGQVVVPPLSKEQLGEVRRRLLEVAAERGLTEAKAVAVADAVVTRLALDQSAAEG